MAWRWAGVAGDPGRAGPFSTVMSQALANAEGTYWFWMKPEGVGAAGAGRIFDLGGAAAPAVRGFALMEADAGPTGARMRVQLNHDGGTHATAQVQVALDVWQLWAVRYTRFGNAIDLHRGDEDTPPELIAVGTDGFTRTGGVGNRMPHQWVGIGNRFDVPHDRQFHGTLPGLHMTDHAPTEDELWEAWRGILPVRGVGTTSVAFNFQLRTGVAYSEDLTGRAGQPGAFIVTGNGGAGTGPVAGPPGRAFGYGGRVLLVAAEAAPSSDRDIAATLGPSGQLVSGWEKVEAIEEGEWLTITLPFDVPENSDDIGWEWAVKLLIDDVLAGEKHYLDAASVRAGDRSEWTRGGLVGVGWLAIERSVEEGVGAFVRDARKVVVPASERFSLIDREAPSHRDVRYRVTRSAEVEGLLLSTPSGWSPRFQTQLTRTWLRSIFHPELDMPVWVAVRGALTRNRRGQIHVPHGRRSPVGVFSGWTSYRAETTFVTETVDEKEALRHLLEHGAPLFLHHPGQDGDKGEQHYIEVYGEFPEAPGVPEEDFYDPARTLVVPWYETDAPAV